MVPAFNPTMVRLQQDCKPLHLHHPRSFQSHYGAIATYTLDHPPNPQGTFNPTMVRLQLVYWFARNCGNYFFQSHYGAIATFIPIPVFRLSMHTFNPTMVRLQPVLKRLKVMSKLIAFNPTMVRLQLM